MKYKLNDIVEGTITGILKYGAFVKVNNKYNGLIHISEVSKSYVKNIDDYLQVGDKIKARIIEVDNKKEQLKLSIKDIDYNNKSINNRDDGFNSLKTNLKYWIEEKIAEINNE